ncbi:phage tail protein [Pseudomonas aeruginosa]
MSLETQIAALVSAANTLTAAVNGKIAEINTRVNQSFADFTSWKNTVQAKDINGRPQYKQTIDLTGLPTDYFYPVWWLTPGNSEGESSLVIYRDFRQDASLDPFKDGSSYVGGVNLQIDGCGNAWDGGANYLHIKRLSQTYRKHVRSIAFRVLAIARKVNGVKPLYNNLVDGQVTTSPNFSGVYLRGGLTYHIVKSFPGNVLFSKVDSEVSIYETVSADFEIKYTVRPWHKDAPELGADYGEYKLPYSYDLDTRYSKVV